MNDQDIRSLIIFHTKHPKLSPENCYNQWHAQIGHKFSPADILEALYISSLSTDQEWSNLLDRRLI